MWRNTLKDVPAVCLNRQKNVYYVSTYRAPVNTGDLIFECVILDVYPT